MGRPPIDQEARRLEIAAAAARVIRKRGLHRTKLSDVADELNLTTGALQHYFKTKEELLQLTKNTLVDHALDDALRVSQDVRGRSRLQLMAKQLLPLDEARHDMWLVIIAYLGEAVGNLKIMNVQFARYKRSQDIFAQEIKNLQAEKEIPSKRDPFIEAFSLLAFIEGIALQVIFSKQGVDAAGQQQLIVRYIDRMLAS